MKTSIRNKKFTLGILLFLIIILTLSIFSAIYLNKLSTKTSAILKENHVSVVYARDMSKNLTIINQEIVNYLLTNKKPDTLTIIKKVKLFEQSLYLEKNNITEIGEAALVSEIETGFGVYRNSISNLIKSPKEANEHHFLIKQYDKLYQKLMLLSQLNEKAIEFKTNDAKIAAKNASIQMSIIAAICLIIAFAFSFSFSSYYNERFFKLYDGIKEMSASNYQNKLILEGKDELSEISTIFNEMVEKLNKDYKKTDITNQPGSKKELSINDIEELKETLNNIKNIEKQAIDIISKFENKK